MKRISVLGIILAVALSLASCASKSYDSSPAAYPSYAVDNGAAYYDGESYSDSGYDYDYTGVAPATEGSWSDSPAKESTPSAEINRKLIKTANLAIESTTFDESVAAIERLNDEFGGYIESSNVYGTSAYSGYNNGRSANYRLRIPENKYDAFLQSAGSIGNLTSKSQNAQDVTDAYFDTASRLKAIEMRRDRLFALLEKAEDAESIIALEISLSDAVYEIESLTSQIRRYDNQVGYSSIDISLMEVIEFTPVEPPPPITFGQRLSTAFTNGASRFKSGLESFVVWFVGSIFGIIIFAIIVVAAVLIIRKAAGKYEKPQKTMAPPKEQPQEPKEPKDEPKE